MAFRAALAVAVVLAVFAAPAAAVKSSGALPMPHGSYLGCYNLSRLEQPTHYKSHQLDAASLGQCRPRCRADNFSIMLLTPDYLCRCSHRIPGGHAAIGSARCQPGRAGAAAFYLHEFSDTVRCRVAEVPLEQGNPDLQAQYKPENIEFDPAGTLFGSMRLRLAEPEGGARIAVRDAEYLYGAIEVRAKPACGDGVVTAFYLRSSDVYPNEAANALDGPISEIDYEWVSFLPETTCSLWLNSFNEGRSNGEMLVKPEEYQAKAKWPANRLTNTTWATYGINWQPGSVTWTLDGRVLRHRANGDPSSQPDKFNPVFESPSKPSHPVISMWTDTRPEAWGGRLDPAAGPYVSSFKQMRRVLCDRTVLVDVANPEAQSGPSWLYEA